MMVMTAKVDLKKVLMILAAVAVLILSVVMLAGGREDAAQTSAPALTGNDARVAYLKDMGWEVITSPTESGKVKIPKETTEVFDRYNTLQKSQGFDLSAYAGKNVMRYVYQVTNYPGATAPVYATLLIHKEQVIGGDVTDTAPGGQLRPLQKPQTAPTETTAPS